MSLIDKLKSCLPTKPPKERLESIVRGVATAGLGRRKPKYYTGSHGQFANFKDFDTDKMVEDFSAEFPELSKDEVRGVVMQGIYQHYLR